MNKTKSTAIKNLLSNAMTYVMRYNETVNHEIVRRILVLWEFFHVGQRLYKDKTYALGIRLYTRKEAQQEARTKMLQKMAWVLQPEHRLHISPRLFHKIAKLYYSL